MRDSDLAGAAAGFRAAAIGIAVGGCAALAGWGFTALRGDTGFPYSALGAVVMPVGISMSRLWQRWPTNRRPATVVALTAFALVAAFSAALGDAIGVHLDLDPDREDGADWMTLGYIPGALLAGTLFGALAGEPGPRATHNWVRFDGRSRRFHRAVYGGLAVLLVATVALAVLG